LPVPPDSIVFGPVNSRRLGFSLGVDLTPSKTCNFNCVYCEVGPTVRFATERREYIPTARILAAVDQALSDPMAAQRLDVVTVTASGEPTLHSSIGAIIRRIKERVDKPVAVLTNGSLLHLPEVREALFAADIVIPSLDSAREESFRRVNRPAPGIELQKIIEGTALFAREFPGSLWIEVLLVKGMNDQPEDMEALKAVLPEISPEKVQLHTVTRPGVEPTAEAVDMGTLRAFSRTLSPPVEIVAGFCRDNAASTDLAPETLVEILKRRPATVIDLAQSLGIDPGEATSALCRLEKSGVVRRVFHQGKEYFQTKRR